MPATTTAIAGDGVDTLIDLPGTVQAGDLVIVVGAIVDGVTVATTGGQSSDIDTSAKPLYLGSDDRNTYYDGRIDEFRISSVVRSAAWLAATWENIDAPNTFYFVGSEESEPAAPTADEGSQLYINNGRMKVDNGRIISDQQIKVQQILWSQE